MIESTGVKLPAQEWERIIQLGMDGHIKELESELARTIKNIQMLEVKYKMTFARLEEVGLPDNAGWKEHEDYVEWSSWEGYRTELNDKLDKLRALAQTNAR